MWNYEKAPRVSCKHHDTKPQNRPNYHESVWWTGVPYQMIKEKSQCLCGFAGFRNKIKKRKVEIHGPGSFFIDDTIHDGAEQKSFFLGWFFWIFQNIIDVFYLFPEIFF